MGAPSFVVVVLSAALQLPQSVVTGHVRDADTGAPIPGATVVLSELERGVLTDAAGGYALSGVPPGPQHLTVSSVGYGARTVHALVPAAGSLQLDVVLRSEPIPLTGLKVVRPVTLRGGEAESIDPLGGRTLSAAAVRASPLLAEADVFAALVGGEVFADPEAPSGLHVRGGRTDHVGYTIDGIPVLDPLHSAGLFSAWSPAALAGIGLDPPKPSAALFGGLSGVVAGTAREPGTRMGGEATISSTHASAVAHGPVSESAGYVVALRSGFPGGMPARGEPSYLAGESGDGLVRIGVPLLTGRLSVLGYAAENEIANGNVTDAGAGAAPPPNDFEWTTRSLGAVWKVPASTWGDVTVRAWSASTASSSDWGAAEGRARLSARRRHTGVQIVTSDGDRASDWEVGIGLARLGAAYSGGSIERDGERTVGTVHAEGRVALGRGWRVGGGGALVLGPFTRLSPTAELAWHGAGPWTTSLRLSRTHQLTQSLRDAESVAGRIFAAEPSVLAGSEGMPVPTADELAVGLGWRPGASVRVVASGYVRTLRSVVTVAPVGGAPFSTESVVIGTGRARGVTLDAVASGARFTGIVGYGLQRVRYTAGGGEYTPSQGATHLVDVGVVAYPSATWSVRVGANAEAGRRSVDLLGPFEWEACNVLDGGCEFLGSPTRDGPLGGRALPTYVRVDLGVRKHWHASVAGRETVLGAFATVTNVLGRRNVMAYVRDYVGGALAPVEMRPSAPLVVGFDWRF